MLIYHPAFDAFHCIYRLLLITEVHREIDAAKLRIVDFYIIFPAELRKVTLPKKSNDIKKSAKLLVNRYRGPISAAQVFREMEQIQLAAISALAAADLIDKASLAAGIIRRTQTEVAPAIRAKIDNFFHGLTESLGHVLNELAEMPLNGIDGLKHRTGLMEYRYDNV